LLLRIRVENRRRRLWSHRKRRGSKVTTPCRARSASSASSSASSARGLLSQWALGVAGFLRSSWL
jgi:hypothetical protein